MKNKYLPLFLLSSLFFGCSEKVEQKPTLPRVEVGSVVRQTIPISLNAVGHVTAFKSAEIKAQVEGRLLEVHYEEGSLVKAGDLLLTINPEPYLAALEKALAVRAENFAKLKYAAEVVVRYKGLLKEDYISQLDFDGFVRDLGEYEAAVMQDDADIRLAKINLDYCYLRSPFTGIAGKKLIDEGNLITDDGTTMVVVNQIDPIYIDFFLPEADFQVIMKFKKGDTPLEVDIKIPNEKDPYKATLILVDNTIDPNTGMVPLRAQINNKAHDFWPGQYVEANLILTHEENALLIPSKAISIGSKGQYVYVIGQNNVVEYKSIQSFNIYGKSTHIKAELKEGDRVITRGQINVKAGSACQIVTKDSKK
jgi:membrane fusion protein, multidrug efflux system